MTPIPSLVVASIISLAKENFADRCLCLLQHGRWENSSTEATGGRIEVSHIFFSASFPLNTCIGILILNICLILPLLTASINGYDSSLVNGTNGGVRIFCFAQQVCARSSDSSFVAGVLQSPRWKGTGSVITSILFLTCGTEQANQV